MAIEGQQSIVKLTETPESYWLASTSQTNYPTLDRDISAEVAIIGGGLVGITTAFLLKKEGVKVAVIEADRIGQGTTGHTTAKITSQHGLIYDKLKTKLGEELAQQYASANETAIKTIAEIIKENSIDCDFQWKPAYIFTQSEQYVDKLRAEAETAAGLGIKAHYLEEIPLPFEVKAAVRFDGQAQFHPRKYLLALAQTIPGDGSYIFEQTRAVDIEGQSVVITKTGQRISAQNIIIASHYPFYDALGFYFTRIYPVRSYILGVKIRDTFPEGMFINAETPTRSLRSQRDGEGELILFAGEHHKTGEGQNLLSHYGALRDFAVTNFAVDKILYRWSTQDYETPDSVPFIGNLSANTPNIFTATGFKKWGMTTSTVSAVLLRDLITKGESPWHPVYNPSRLTLQASAAEFIKQNVKVAKNLITGKLAPVPDGIEVKEGEGRIAESDGIRVGVYRDQRGRVHTVDTTCTHMGCELNWNDAEKTWDCPCHGSRFTYEGEIVEGPAHHNLNHLEEGANKIDPNIV